MSFNRSGYIGRAPGDSAITIAKQYFQPTSVGKTFTFASGYDPGLVDVYRNGIKLINVLDYAATDGTTISLSTPVGVGSTVQVVAYKAYNVATVKATELDTTVTGNTINLSGDITATNVTANTAIYVGSAFTANAAGDVETIGIITASSFSGDGTGLTGVASTDNIITGTAATFTNTGVNAGVPNLNVVGLATVGILTAYGTLSGTVAEFSAESTFSDVLNIGGIVNANATTDSTSTTTGALIVDGGVGIAKNVYIGAGLSVAGTLTYEDVTNVDSVGMVTAKSGVNVSGGELNVGLGFSVGNVGVVTAQNVTISAGTIDLKNSGSVSNIKFYCESSNAHYTALQSAAHSAYGGNVTLTLPTTTDTLVARTTTDTLTNKTLTSPTLTTPVFSGQATGELKVGSGITIAATSGVATFADGSSTSNALHFGTGADLTIYHDGSTSNIVNTSGTLNVGVNNFVVQRQGLDETMLYAQANTSVWLYYDNVIKLNTTKFGSITAGVHTATQGFFTSGVCTATSFSGDGSALTGIEAGISTSISTAAGIVSTLALADAQDHKVTVSGITTFTCNGGTEGDSHTLRLVNSGVTTVGFSTYFLFPSGSAPSIPTADGTVSLISFTVHRQGSAGIATQLLAGASLNFS